MTDFATDGTPIYEIAARAALKRFERGAEDAITFWRDRGGERDEAFQAALIRAWVANEKWDGRTKKITHLMVQAKFGLLDYVKELRADQSKRSPACVVQAGLDDEDVDWIFSEVFLDDDDCTIQPEAKQDVSGAEAREEGRLHLRSVLEAAARTCLEEVERDIVWLRFGINEDCPLTQREIADETGVSQATVYRILSDAIVKLRAEMRADEILSL